MKCKNCGCDISGNYHINLDNKYIDKNVYLKKKTQSEEVGTVWVKICKPHNCTTPEPDEEGKP